MKELSGLTGRERAMLDAARDRMDCGFKVGDAVIFQRYGEELVPGRILDLVWTMCRGYPERRALVRTDEKFLDDYEFGNHSRHPCDLELAPQQETAT